MKEMMFKNKIDVDALTEDLIKWAYFKLSFNELKKDIPWGEEMEKMEPWTSRRVEGFISQELDKFSQSMGSDGKVMNDPETKEAAYTCARSCAKYISAWYGMKCEEYNAKAEVDRLFPVYEK